MLADMMNQREKFDNFTFTLRIPDGTANIIILEDSPGVIYKIFFNIGKAGTSTNAWANALAEMTVAYLQTGKSLTDAIVLLSNITSDRSTYQPDGVAIRSGPEALCVVLMRYRNLYKDKQDRVTYAKGYRAPRMGV